MLRSDVGVSRKLAAREQCQYIIDYQYQCTIDTVNLLADSGLDNRSPVTGITILLQAFAPLALGMLISTTYITVMFDG